LSLPASHTSAVLQQPNSISSRLSPGFPIQRLYSGEHNAAWVRVRFSTAVRARRDFLAAEVKGLKGRTGSLAFAPKEHQVAKALRKRFFLFVVKNFAESPFHEMYQDPLGRQPSI
jgi:hypothetical protein